jgi:3-deoxy-D-manno-octulosonic-acid transferase
MCRVAFGPHKRYLGGMAGDVIYELIARLMPHAAEAGALFSARLSRGVAGRRATLLSLRAWAADGRDPARPLVWLHAPSVGEALMAQAILSELRRLEPRLQAAFTHFSPSAERTAAGVGADWSGYLPWDTRAHALTALQALQPACIAFVRTEIWPVLMREAALRSVRTLLVNAVLAQDSSRLGTGARVLLGDAYRRLDAVGAASDEDAATFPRLGVAPARVRVTGDARFDQVLARLAARDPRAPLLQPFRDARGPWLVAGSTWPADEERLVGALLTGARDWRAIIAPHEPTPAHLDALERRLDDAGISHARLHDAAAPQPVTARVTVVDRVGVLADLYAAGAAAYVGGGFGRAGLHSVVEPAALGVPVMFGPRHGNAREADRLARAGGGFVVSGASDMAALLQRLGTDTDARRAAADAARAFVDAHAGGAEGNARLILEHL